MHPPHSRMRFLLPKLGPARLGGRLLELPCCRPLLGLGRRSRWQPFLFGHRRRCECKTVRVSACARSTG
eukprot:14295348-Alexandrium_andersonii.AAC.1